MRASSFTDEQKATALGRLAAGTSATIIAKELKVSPKTIYLWKAGKAKKTKKITTIKTAKTQEVSREALEIDALMTATIAMMEITTKAIKNLEAKSKR